MGKMCLKQELNNTVVMLLSATSCRKCLIVAMADEERRAVTFLESIVGSFYDYLFTVGQKKAVAEATGGATLQLVWLALICKGSRAPQPRYLA